MRYPWQYLLGVRAAKQWQATPSSHWMSHKIIPKFFCPPKTIAAINYEVIVYFYIVSNKCSSIPVAVLSFSLIAIIIISFCVA